MVSMKTSIVLLTLAGFLGMSGHGQVVASGSGIGNRGLLALASKANAAGGAAAADTAVAEHHVHIERRRCAVVNGELVEVDENGNPIEYPDSEGLNAHGTHVHLNEKQGKSSADGFQVTKRKKC